MHIILNNIETFGDYCINASLNNERQILSSWKKWETYIMIQLNLKLQLLVYILYRKNINIKFTIEKNIFHSKKRPMHFTNGPKMYAKC